VRTFVDRGGTFTDVVQVDEKGRAMVKKVPSDAAVVGELAQGRLVFGTTVATNALLERKHARTLLVVSEGFGDLVRIGDMSRPRIFDPDADWPEPLCAAVLEVPGRIDAGGEEVEPLRRVAVPEGFDAVAVVLINSHKNPSHELQVAGWFEGFVSLGHQVDPELGYLARIHTTLVDAAVTPVVQAALDRDRIPSDALAMRSDGSLVPGRELRAPDAVLSGPAGGVLAVAEIARQAGFDAAVGLDMGGTSTDVCRVEVGRLPRVEGEVRVAGVRLRRPMLEVVTIAAGGGSVLGHDGLRMTVGPESAGADPGPACYGRGGPPTLTDAALHQGLVDPDAFDPPLVAQPLPGPSEDYLAIAREKMAQAVRRIATSRGIGLEGHGLVAYGGAAGAHAARVAERLGIDTVLVHPCAAVLSAWGQSLARVERRAVKALWTTDFSLVLDFWSGREGERTVDVRVRGTDFFIEVDGGDEAAVQRAFRAQHQRRFGYAPQGAIEYVNARVRWRGEAPKAPTMDIDWGVEGVVDGPRVLFCPTTAVEVPRGWRAEIRDGLLRLDRHETSSPSAPGRDEAALELWSNRFMAVAEQAGEVLRRTARSVNIRERLDFSCAVFNARGQLVANAPHIPVHLGAMGETVRDLIATGKVLEGNHWLCNDPSAGGSHLPDLTVVSCAGPFFVASRGHHVDVGGLTPGSMPPDSRTLEDEGQVFRHVPLLVGGRFAPPTIGRQPQVVAADLAAQVAANVHAASALQALGEEEAIASWMERLHALADASLQLDLCGSARLGPLGVEVERVRERLRVVFDAPPAREDNRNAPRAVVRAAVLYVLRCLAGSRLPLNEGVLRRVDLVIPEGSMLDPPAGRAVVAGNVETSMKLVDLLFAAVGGRAGSQGTMNNLTLGGQGWSFYETLGGGGGGSVHGPGRSARQHHMTNTRATDVEVLEARLPLRAWRLSLRPESGGVGRHRGGDGLIRELELLSDGTASLLASSRDRGGHGLGGEDGKPGQDQVCRGGRWQPWDGRPTSLSTGDRVRVHTPGGGGCTPDSDMS